MSNRGETIRVDDTGRTSSRHISLATDISRYISLDRCCTKLYNTVLTGMNQLGPANSVLKSSLHWPVFPNFYKEIIYVMN